MAVGGVVNVAPVAPGQYRADFANGQSMLLTGKPGEDEYNRFQVAQSLGARGAVAGPGAGKEITEEEQGGALRTLGKVAALANPLTAGAVIANEAGKRLFGKNDAPEAPPAAPAAAKQGASSAPATTPAAAQEAEPQQAAPQATGPVSLGQTLEATDPATGKKFTGEAFRMPDGTVRVMRQGTPGSPGGLTALGKQTMQQYAEAQTLAGEHSAKAAEHQQTAVDLAVQQAEARQAYLEEQKIQTQLAMQQQADEEAAIQQKVTALEASHEKARQEFASARVDPDRYVKSKPGGNWILGLSAALGAFGASLARTPNFAMEFINGRIADDIRSQEAEINVKGRDADNQLAQLTKALGDLSLAKKSFRQLKLEEAAIEGQRVAGQFQGQQIANNARLVAEQAAAEGIRAGEERSRGFVEHVMKDKLYYRQGSAGTPGGFFLTGTSELQGRKNLEQVDDPRSKAAAEAAARAVPAERTGAITGMASTIDAANRIEQNIAARNMGEDNTLDDPLSGGIDAVVRAGSAVTGGDRVKRDNALRADTFELARGLQQAYGKSDNDAQMADSQAAGSASAADRLRAARSTRERAIKGLRQELSTLQPNQQEALLSTMSPEARKAVLGQK